MDGYEDFKSRLRVKCLPHYTDTEFDSLIERVTKNSRENEKKVNTLESDSTVLREQQCSRCENRDQNYFFFDVKRGGVDTICMGVKGRGCGMIVQDHKMEDSAAHRNFEGEEDRNHYGPAANKLLTEAVNYRTVLGSSAPGKESAELKRLSETHVSLEMNYSKIGNDERRTRDGYKNDQKKKAFAEMEQLADALRIHAQVVRRAQEEFACYRDHREAVHQYEGIVAACLAFAFKEIAGLGGDVRRKELVYVPRKLEEKAPITDLAVTTHAAAAMKTWSLAQVESWLEAVRGGHQQDAAELVNKVKETLQTDEVEQSKRKYPSTTGVSFLGSTTVAGRKKKALAIKCGHEAKMTAGQALIKIYLSEFRFSSSGQSDREEKHPIRDAIRLRLDYDVKKDTVTAIQDESANKGKKQPEAPPRPTQKEGLAIKIEQFFPIQAGASTGSVDVPPIKQEAQPPPVARATPSPVDGDAPLAKKARFIIN